MRNEVIKHKTTGKVYTVKYTLIDIKPSWERVKVRKSLWWCPPKGSCGCVKV